MKKSAPIKPSKPSGTPTPKRRSKIPVISTSQSRLEELETDKYFVEASARMFESLAEARKENEEIVKLFLDKFALPVGQHVSKLTRFIIGTNPPEPVSQFIHEYIAFVNRFRMSIVLRTKSGKQEPRLISWLEPGPILHAEIREGHLVPTKTFDDDAGMAEIFDGQHLHVLQAVRDSMLRPSVSGKRSRDIIQTSIEKAKFLQIEDEDWSSALSEIERLAYEPNGITFIVHNARYPYLFVLLGEALRLEDLRQLLPVIEKLRNKYQGRVNRGRPANAKVLAADLKTLSEPTSMKQKAIESTERLRANSLSGDALEKAIATNTRRLQRRKAKIKTHTK
jgi:hypothetical protein